MFLLNFQKQIYQYQFKQAIGFQKIVNAMYVIPITEYLDWSYFGCHHDDIVIFICHTLNSYVSLYSYTCLRRKSRKSIAVNCKHIYWVEARHKLSIFLSNDTTMVDCTSGKRSRSG